MILESLGREAFARESGLISDDGEVSERGLADLLRSPLSRWGLSPRSNVLRHARDQLDAAGLRGRASHLLPAVLDNLMRLGECEDVAIGHERYIAPAPPRWIRTGEASAALLGVGPSPKGIIERSPDPQGRDVVRRIEIRSEEDLAVLRIADVGEISIFEWLKPLGYLQYGIRRAGRLIRSDQLSLPGFWDSLVSEAAEKGLPLGGDAEVRAVVGGPGGYFGSHDAESCEGRWSEVASDGFWCAFRRGYGQTHWHPIVLEVDGAHRRAMDLYDHDEWRWSLLARGHYLGTEESIDRCEGRVRVGFPAPGQLLAAMDIVGPRRGPWTWEVNHAAPDPWAGLR